MDDLILREDHGDDDKTATIEELCELFDRSRSTVQRFLKDNNIEGIPVHRGGRGNPRLEYLVKNYQVLWETRSLSQTGKIKYLIGDIELEGTPEQRDAIRNYVDDLRLTLLEERDKHKQELEFKERQYKEQVRVANEDWIWKKLAREQDAQLKKQELEIAELRAENKQLRAEIAQLRADHNAALELINKLLKEHS